MASSNDIIDLFVDETYLLALLNDEPVPISDEKYALELTLQEALYSSSSTSPPFTHDQQNPPKTLDFPTSKMFSNFQHGESSSSSPSSSQGSNTKKLLFCGICMEMKRCREIFPGLPKCSSHAYCITCVTNYVTSKIKDNISSVECPYPKCGNKIDPQNCAGILPREVFARWEDALCEAMILSSQRFYCPYKDCSALMVDDAAVTVVEAECPSCRRLFCARCKVKWHVGVTCEEFGRLKDYEKGCDDLVIMKMANDKNWRRCGNCRFFVEKSDGCLHMTCRCKYEFCYKCGTKWSSGHAC